MTPFPGCGRGAGKEASQTAAKKAVGAQPMAWRESRIGQGSQELTVESWWMQKGARVGLMTLVHRRIVGRWICQS